MNFFLRILVSIYCFSSCVTSNHKISQEFDMDIVESQSESLDSCKFVRKFSETPGSMWGGSAGQQAAIAKIADRAQDYNIDTLLITERSWSDGAVSAKGYICGAKG